MNSKFHSPFFFGGEHIKLTIAEPECVHLLPFPSIKGDISHSVNAVIPLLVIFGVFWIYGHQIIFAFNIPISLDFFLFSESFSLISVLYFFRSFSRASGLMDKVDAR